MGTIFDRAGHDRLGHLEQLGGAVLLAALDGRLAGHGVEQGVPGRAWIGRAAGEQAAGQLGEHVGDLPGGHVAGGGPDDQRPAAEVLRLKAEAPQQRELGQQGGPLLRRRGEHHRLQQGLYHRLVALGLHPVEVQPLVGGVLVDEEHLVSLLHYNVGVEHLPRHAPGLLLRRGRRGRPCRLGGRGFGRTDVGIRPYGPGGGNWCAGGRGGFSRAGTAVRPRGRRGGGWGGEGAAPGGLGDGDGGAGDAVPGRGCRGGPCGPGGGEVVEGQGRCGPFRRPAELLQGHLPVGGGRRSGLRRAEGRLRRPPPLRRARGLHLEGRPGAVGLQSGLDGIVHRVKDLLVAAELDLLLGGVYVDIHRVEPGGQVEDAAGKFAHHLLIGVGLLQGGHHGAAFHIPAVDEEVLVAPGAPAAGGQGDKAGHRHILPRTLHRREAKGHVTAQHGVEGRLHLPVAGGEQLLLAVPEELDAHLRVGQGHPLHHGEAGRPLGGVLFQELEPGGGVVEQVAHHHCGALGAAGLFPVHHRAPLQGEGGPQILLRRAGEQLDAGDGGDGRQSLPPEAQGADGLQIVLGAQFAGGVAEEGGLRLGGGDAAAVVGNPDEAHAAVLDLHGQGVRPGVDSVLHELLDHRRGPLHHLAGGDQIGHVGI